MGKINNSNKLKFIIIGGIILFFSIIFIYNLIKLGIFNKTRYINQFPDTIHIHFPYFIVVVPEDTKQISTVYSLTQKKQIATFNDIVLDYFDGSFLYNYHGGNTYFKGKNLKYHCDQGFIKSDTEILCVTQNISNPLYSDLISINPHTFATKSIYSPQDAITALYYYKSTLYLGEYDYNSHKAFLTINDKKTNFDSFISIIYPMQNSMNVATLKNTENNLSSSYTQIIYSNYNVSSNLINKGSVVFYK